MILRKFMFCNRKLRENIVCKGFSPFSPFGFTLTRMLIYSFY